MNKLLSWFDLKYLFDPTPRGEIKGLYILLGIFILSILAGMAYKRYLKKKKEDYVLRRVMSRFPRNLIILGIGGLLYLFVRWQQMPYISMRFLGIVLFVLLLINLVSAIYKLKKVYPGELRVKLKRIDTVKYLPRKKKR